MDPFSNSPSKYILGLKLIGRYDKPEEDMIKRAKAG